MPLLPAVMSVFPLVQTKTCDERLSSHLHREGGLIRTCCEIFVKIAEVDGETALSCTKTNISHDKTKTS